MPPPNPHRQSLSAVTAALAAGDATAATREFYAALRQEVTAVEASSRPRVGATARPLPDHDAARPLSTDLVATIYVERRAPAVAAILQTEEPAVFDAGCGFGSESYLFAAAGARVLAVDRDPERIVIARRRQAYYEELIGRRLEITWAAGDLDSYDPPERRISLTWMASVLAAVDDQEALLRRLHAATRPGGRVMLTDMNLLNPLFTIQEWRRRRRGAESSVELARRANFHDMFFRRCRRGARYYPAEGGELFDDAQFFWWKTLARLFRRSGFEPGKPKYSGFVPPLPGGRGLHILETVLARLPLLRHCGYFYLMSGVKPDRS